MVTDDCSTIKHFPHLPQMIPNDNIPPPQEEKNESYVEKKRKNVYNLKNSNVEKLVNGGHRILMF